MKTKNFQNTTFFNNSSKEKFIGNRSLSEVINHDESELEEIGGNFYEIAERMKELVEWAEDKKPIFDSEELKSIARPVIEDYEKKYGESWHKRSNIWRGYQKDWAKKLAKHSNTYYDDKISVIQYLSTRGLQSCPFEECEEAWNEDVKVVNRKTGKGLTINSGTIHLAREHHLLEKDNQYGISAKEFYEQFM